MSGAVFILFESILANFWKSQIFQGPETQESTCIISYRHVCTLECEKYRRESQTLREGLDSLPSPLDPLFSHSCITATLLITELLAQTNFTKTPPEFHSLTCGFPIKHTIYNSLMEKNVCALQTFCTDIKCHYKSFCCTRIAYEAFQLRCMNTNNLM